MNLKSLWVATNEATMHCIHYKMCSVKNETKFKVFYSLYGY